MTLNKYLTTINLIIFSGIIIRLIMISINYFSGTNSFIGPDSYGLHHTALMLSKRDFLFILSQNYHLHNFYLFIVPLFYKISPFTSYTFASLISVFCWFVSVLFCLDIMKMIRVKKTSIYFGLVLLCFWPSLVLFTSAVSREAFQIMLICASIFLTIKILYYKKIGHFLLLIFCSIILSLFHKAFFFFALWNLLIAFIPLVSNLITLKIKFIFSLLIILILFILIQNYDNFGYKQFAKGLPIAVEIYQNGLLINSNSRADMRTYPISVYNYSDLLAFIFIATYDYFVQPFFSKILSIGDLLAFVENYLRIFFIFTGMILLFRIRSLINLKYTSYLFFTFCFIEIVWALGTSNWGTALRHHTTAIPILILFFVSFFKDEEYIIKS